MRSLNNCIHLTHITNDIITGPFSIVVSAKYENMIWFKAVVGDELLLFLAVYYNNVYYLQLIY